MAEGSAGGQIPKSHFTKGKYVHFSISPFLVVFTSICFRLFGHKKRNMLLRLATRREICCYVWPKKANVFQKADFLTNNAHSILNHAAR